MGTTMTPHWVNFLLYYALDPDGELGYRRYSDASNRLDSSNDSQLTQADNMEN